LGDCLTLQIRNTPDAIAPAGERAEVWLEQFQPSPAALHLVLLAIEELVTNCIKYAYRDADEHIVVVELNVADRNLTLTVIDDGQPFDPLAAPRPDLTLDIEDRPIGGLGIHLLRKLADTMTYERRDDTNRLTLTKPL
jgi:anti-sigma regulatory factor (Ser/Thr protein kinase)